MKALKRYTANEIDKQALNGQRLLVIGYGSQGSAQALNLRDSGFSVRVAARKGGAGWNRALADGFEPYADFSAAVRESDIIALLLPDTALPTVWTAAIQPALTPGKTLIFAHGFNIAYQCVNPPTDIDVVLVAPKAIGPRLRSLYTEGAGPACLVGVHSDATGSAERTAVAWASGIGADRSVIMKTTFKDETETDLFGEQAVLCGGLTHLIQTAFETLTDAGYAPELAYYECLHEVKLIADMVYANGIQAMRAKISDTARYGDLTRGPRLINDSVRETMKTALSEIQSGAFAREFITAAGKGVNYDALDESGAAGRLLEDVGRTLRREMGIG